MVALGVSNVILRALELSSIPDLLLCLLTAIGLADFVAATFSQLFPKSLLLIHSTQGPVSVFLPKVVALLYLASMLLLTYLSAKNEEKKSKNHSSFPNSELKVLRGELDTIQKRLASKAHN
jgi:hypothetical protein